MFRQWLTLVTIVLVYIPVAIDATMLYIAVPTPSMTLGASSNELPWIIDIYSLVMAGMMLPTGMLGDRISFKCLLLLGDGSFGLTPLVATFAYSASWLITIRAVLATGAAMTVPAMLTGIRAAFSEQWHRNMALGVWTAIGSGDAVFGPLVSGMPLERFYWGSVFLINAPTVLVVMALTVCLMPRQVGRRGQSLSFDHATMLIVAILSLVYSARAMLRGHTTTIAIAPTLLTSALLLQQFVHIQLAAVRPMTDMRLFTRHTILSGVVVAMTAAIMLAGFELLTAQELQFAHGLAPYQAGPFILPMMLANGFNGPIAGTLVSRLGLRYVATADMVLNAVSFYGLAMTDFSSQQVQAWILVALPGFSAASALLVSAAAIMAAVPAEKAVAADTIEIMAYELGVGLEIAIFGLPLSRSFSASVLPLAGLNPQEVKRATSSMKEAVQLTHSLPSSLSEILLTAARGVFTWSHSVTLSGADGTLITLAIGVWFSLAKIQC